MAETAHFKFSTGIIIILSALVLFLGGAALYYHGEDQDWRSSWAKRDADDARRNLEAQQLKQKQDAENRERERQQALKQQQTVQRLQDEVKTAENRAQRVIDDYRNGSIRLRERFQCGIRAASGADPTPATSAIRDAASACGLGSEDVEFLVQYGKRAAQLAAQLTAAQLELCSYYETVNQEPLNYEVCKNGDVNRKETQ